MCDYLETALSRHGFEVVACGRPARALELLDAESFDVLLTDLNMPGMSGNALCAEVLARGHQLPVVVLTAFGSQASAYAAIRAGAYDFLTKPIEAEALALVLRRAHERRRLQLQVAELERARAARSGFGRLLGESPAMQRLFGLLERVSATESSVLICGETGSGKELAARAVHEWGPRRDAAFVAINCAALPEGLLESELFGHLEGAFSGATRARAGLILEAHGGTLFLDEVGDMPLSLQARLLRVLQDGKVRPVGSDKERSVDVRLLAATHRDLEAAVEDGRFREDLYFRLNVIRVDLPPLRARGGDAVQLAEAFLAELCEERGRPPLHLAPDAARALLSYDWPGNVRELRNCVERAFALCAGEQIRKGDLPPKLAAIEETEEREVLHLTPFGNDPDLLPTLEELERRYAEHVMRVVGGNKTLAAKVLGLDRRTLYRKLERWRLAEPAADDDG
ncbi:MAG: sigma-54-dependent Fis family transcriptional regulator [Planctomycetes bacterium]|nr:sigma-54-dependent Fis family transcriptional regulator [Planctomycetota bacterium]